MEIKVINTQKVLSPTQISIADYVINPYRGCEFGCTYCYSQENKNIKKSDFYNTLHVKANAPEILERELRYTRPRRVLLGSTTECFQYQELKYATTYEILEILNKFNIPYTILTKSNLIEKYLEIISANKKNKIYFTLNFSSDNFIEIFENKSPLLNKRIDAIAKIIEKGIDFRLHIGPYIPFISNLENIMAKLPVSIKEIDVELYHHKMGNFSEIIHRTENILGKDLKDKIERIYNQEKNYLEFSEKLKEEIKIKNAEYPEVNFYYIVPEFNNFYNSNINYKNSI